MPNPIIKIINTITGEEIERPMTNAEKTTFEAGNAELAAINAAIKADLA